MEESNSVSAASHAEVIEEETTADEISENNTEEENWVEEIKLDDMATRKKESSKEGTLIIFIEKVQNKN